MDNNELYKNTNPLVFAFVGDAVHTLFVREHVIKKDILRLNDYNKECSKFCKAKSQSLVLDILLEKLTDEEKDLIRRTRNTKIHHTAKNAEVVDYKKATCFEALIGYLYLTKRTERMNEFLEISIKGSN